MQSFLLTVAMLRGNVVLLITISFLVNRSSGAVDRKVENIKQYISSLRPRLSLYMPKGGGKKRLESQLPAYLKLLSNQLSICRL